MPCLCCGTRISATSRSGQRSSPPTTSSSCSAGCGSSSRTGSGSVSSRAAVRDALDACEVHPGRCLDADGSGRCAAALRRQGHAGRARVDLLEAGISALAGVIVFVVGLVIIGGADVPLIPLAAFAVVVGFLLYPPVFGRSRPGCCVHSVRRGGTAPHANDVRADGLLRAHLAARRRRPLLHAAVGGGDPSVSTIPYLGGVAAVGAIVAVLAVFAPSGLAFARRRCTG